MAAWRSSHTQDLLEQMAKSVVPVDDPERSQARREQVVARLESLHEKLDERKQRSQRRTRRIAVLAVAAAPLLAAGGYWLARHSGTPARAPVAQRQAAPAAASQAAGAPARVSVRSGSVLLARGLVAERPVQHAAPLAQGDRIYTGHDGRARVQLHSGTDVEMAPVTQITMGAETAGWRSESVDLERGRVDVSVPTLPAGGSFSVITPDASVEVHGTHFTVIYEPDASGTPRTLVDVRDGKALVRSHGAQTLLESGAHWSSAPGTAAAQTSATTRPGTAPGAGGAAKPTVSSAAAGSRAPTVKPAGGTKLPAVTSASSLAEQNRLFQSAMDARRRGDDARALSLLGQLLGRYPGSPLEQDARVERFRALKRLGKSDEATHAARRYLADHPDGFARDEARQMAIDPGGK